MGLLMKERQAVTKELHMRYKRATKKEKKTILNEFSRTCGYNRSYAARVLRAKLKTKYPPKRSRERPRVYGDDALPALRQVWAIADMICGKRLHPVLPELVGRLEYFKEIKVEDEIRDKLLSMSAATIDRLLAEEKQKFRTKNRGGTKPGTLLKSQIPIRTFSDWDENTVGFVEIDLVGHDGGNPKGDFCQTLDLTDIKTGWTETKAVKNKAQVWVFAALKDIRESFPFPVLGIDSDNGSEFINNELKRFCEDKQITFTRSRPYKKNDNCYVEQKNYSVVRRAVGYLRHDTEEELKTLNELYGHLRLYTNYFSPSMKCIEKTRVGSKTKRRYDTAATPCRRVMASSDVEEDAKKRLEEEYATLNPADLKRKINRLQRRLIKMATAKRQLENQVNQDDCFEYISDEATNDSFEYIFT